MVNRLESEKGRAAATAQAEAQSQARTEVSRILSVERALAQENLQEAIVRERLTTEDARRRTELFVSVQRVLRAANSPFVNEASGFKTLKHSHVNFESLTFSFFFFSGRRVPLYGHTSLLHHMVTLKGPCCGRQFVSVGVTDVCRVHVCIRMSSHSFIHNHVPQSTLASKSWLFSRANGSV